MSKSNLTAEDVLKLVEDRAQWMREEGPADMRDMIYFIRSICGKLEMGKPREDIIKEINSTD